MKVTDPPIEFVKVFLTEEIIELITFQTNLYNTQRSINGYKLATQNRNSTKLSHRKVTDASTSEIRKVLGIILYMGVIKLPNRRMYWGQKTRVPLITETMSRNGFDEVWSVLHYNDNDLCQRPDSPDYDRLHKLRPLIDHLNNKFEEVAITETCVAIDEMTIPFKGKHGMKIYIPKKPVKWGFKLWCRAGVSGYVYRFEVCGDGKAHGPPAGTENGCEYGKMECVVLRLMHSLEPGKHYAFFDNLFASPDVMIYLKARGIFAIATLRADRARGCDLTSELEMKKEGRAPSRSL